MTPNFTLFSMSLFASVSVVDLCKCGEVTGEWFPGEPRAPEKSSRSSGWASGLGMVTSVFEAALKGLVVLDH